MKKKKVMSVHFQGLVMSFWSREKNVWSPEEIWEKDGCDGYARLGIRRKGKRVLLFFF
jgi:hypothetical protein